MIAQVIEAVRRRPLGRGEAVLVALGQSGFVLRLADIVVVVDPFLSPNDQRLVPADESIGSTTGIDVIACTHEHRDHLDLPTLRALLAGSPSAALVVPEPVAPAVVAAGIDPSRVMPAQPSRRLQFGQVVIDSVAARHGVHVADAYTSGEELSDGLVRYLGYIFAAPGIVLYHAGDTIMYVGLAESLGPYDIDVAMLPINGRDRAREERDMVGNLGPEEAVALAVAAGADLLIPMHYDMYAHNSGRPEDLIAYGRANGYRVSIAVLARGTPFVYAGRHRG